MDRLNPCHAMFSSSESDNSPPAGSRPTKRQRRPRTQFSESVLRLLEASFQQDHYPDIKRREDLANITGVPEARIQTWFQNKRSRQRRRGTSKTLHQASTPVTVTSSTASELETSPCLAPLHLSVESQHVSHSKHKFTPDDASQTLFPLYYFSPLTFAPLPIHPEHRPHDNTKTRRKIYSSFMIDAILAPDEPEITVD